MINTITLVFAFVLFVLAAWRSSPPEQALWNRLVALGLAVVTLAWLLSRVASRAL